MSGKFLGLVFRIDVSFGRTDRLEVRELVVGDSQADTERMLKRYEPHDKDGVYMGYVLPLVGIVDIGIEKCGLCEGAGTVLPGVAKKWSLDLARTCPTCGGSGKVKRP